MKLGKKTPRKGPPPPFLKWQTGEYKRFQDIRHQFPISFLLLCKLMDVTPAQLLKDFIDNLSCGSWKREGRDEAKERLVDYFVAHGYGQAHYNPEEIRQMFREMDALGMLFPWNGGSGLIDKYADWRDGHFKYWFNKWFRNPRRFL